MRYLLEYTEFITEALKLSTAKEYTKAWDKSKWKDLFSRYTDNPKAYRIYLPFTHVQGYVPTPPPIENYLISIGYSVEDYKAGLARDSKSNRVIKIGKLLNQYKESSLLNLYQSDPTRIKPKEYEIVISRHPYDLAGMSTGRGWTSCMSLDAVGDRGDLFIPKDIKAGSIIAYLVKKGDRNISNPVARILIKPYVLVDGKETILVADRTIYGHFIPGFLEQVQDWLDDANRGKSGVYSIHPGLYRQNDDEDLIVALGNLDVAEASERTIKYYTLTRNADPNILDQIASSTKADTTIKTSVALHSNTQSSTLKRLSMDPSSAVRSAVLSNPNTPKEIMIEIIKKLSGKALNNAICRLRTDRLDQAIIQEVWNLLKSKKESRWNDHARLCLAVRSNLPYEVLLDMSIDSYWNIRLVSIRNLTIAKALRNDPNPQVAERAKQYIDKSGQ